MYSQSEKTFGARLANAITLGTHLATFTGYVPNRPEESVPSYKVLTLDIKSQNSVVATHKSAYSTSVALRLNLFTKNPDSLVRTLSLIGGQVRSSFGKTSKEYAHVVGLIERIRGIRTTKIKKDDEGEFVSQSHKSFGSIAQTYSDIIDTLIQFGTAYNPANVAIQIPTLTAQLAECLHANEQVTLTYGKMKTATDLRVELYDELRDRSQRIKDAVKSQFTFSSTEYKLIKGLKI